MKKNISIFLTLMLAIIVSLCSFACSTGEGSDYKPEPNYGTLTIANVTVKEGESVAINPTFSDRRYAIEYTFDGNGIAISAGTVTGISAGTTTVTAKTAYHEATFTVTVTPGVEAEYGTLTVADVNALQVGDSATINAVFSSPDKAEEITYAFDGDAITIANGKVTAVKPGASVIVTATTAHHEDKFIVSTVAKVYDYGTLTVDNIAKIRVGETLDLNVTFSNEEYASDVTYTFNGTAISIENGKVTALKGGQTVTVTATTAYHTTNFLVTIAPNVGTVEIADVTAWVGYAGVEFAPVFSNPDYAEALTYSYDETALEITGNTVKALKAGSYEVTATSDNFTTTFTVKAEAVNTGATDNKGNSSYSASSFSSKATSRSNTWKTSGNAGVTTVFIGDSFFDDGFWTNFYDADYYGGKDALRMGISATTSYDWETWIEGWLSETNPRNIVMHMGTNNIYDDGDNEAEATSNLQRMFTMMHDELPNAKIYYFAISQRSYNAALQAIVTKVNDNMEAWCEAKDWITFIDTEKTLTADMLKDSVHPKPECYAVFRDALANTDIEIADLAVETGINMGAVTGGPYTFNTATGDIEIGTKSSRNVVYLKNNGEYHKGNFMVSGTATMSNTQGGNPWMALFVNSDAADTWFSASKALPMAHIAFGNGNSQMWGHLAGGSNSTIGAFNKLSGKTYDFTVVSYNGTIIYKIGNQYKIISHADFNNAYFGIVTENCTFTSTLDISVDDADITAYLETINEDLYGTLTISNVAKLEVGATAKINAVFSKADKAEAITYTYDSDAIKIENGIVTALKADKVVIVTATTAHHTVKFSVSTKAYDYGKLTVSNLTLTEGETANINAAFSIAGREEEITYTFDGDAIAIENGKVTALKAGETVTVTATTAHHSATFTVTTTAIDYGTITIGDVYVEIGETAKIGVIFSKPEYKSEVTYTYANTTAITVSGNLITAVEAGAKIVVTATTANHSTTFTVYTTEIDYGDLFIENVVDLTEGKTAKINATFTRPKRVEEITYTYDETLISIADGVVTALKGGETVTVTATTAHHSATFTVETTNIDYGVLTIADVAVTEGNSANLDIQFSIDAWECPITYTYDNSVFTINNGVLTAIDGALANADDGKQFTITATTAHHDATFTVTVSLNYGTVSIADVFAWNVAPAASFEVNFSRPNRAETLTYTYDETALAVNVTYNTVTAIKAGTYTVTGASENFSVEFDVIAELVDKTSAKYNNSSYANQANINAWTYRNDSTNKTTVFIGDSFFDYASFWTNFYSVRYPNTDALCLGISATTSYDWETWAADWLSEKQPKNIVMHMGTNNIYDDKDDANTATSALQRMFTVMHNELPNTNIYWYSISQRSNTTYADVVTEVNANMKAWCEGKDWITYIHTVDDLTVSMLKDGVHPKLENYTVFTDALAKTDIELYEKTGYGFGSVYKGGATSYNASTKTLTLSSSGSRTTAYLKNGNAFVEGSFAVSGKVTFSKTTGWAALFVNNAPKDAWFNASNVFPMAAISQMSAGTTKIWGYKAGSGNGTIKAFTNVGTTYDFTVIASGDTVTYVINNEVRVIKDSAIAKTYFGVCIESNDVSVTFSDIKIGADADAYAKNFAQGNMAKVTGSATVKHDVAAATYSSTNTGGRTVSYLTKGGNYYNGNFAVSGTTTISGGWNAMFINSAPADTWFSASSVLPIAHIAFDNGNSQIWGNNAGGSSASYAAISNKTYTFSVVSYNGTVVYKINNEFKVFANVGAVYFGFVNEGCAVNVSKLAVKYNEADVKKAFDAALYTRTQAMSVSKNKANFYDKGNLVNTNTLVTAKLVISGYTAGANTHTVFYVGNDNYRVILWNSNNGGKYNCAYGWNGYNNTSAFGVFTKPANADLVLDIKMLVTDNDAYFFVNGKLKLVLLNCPMDVNFCFSSEKDDARLENVTVISQQYSATEYNAAISTGDLASALATYGSETATKAVGLA